MNNDAWLCGKWKTRLSNLKENTHFKKFKNEILPRVMVAIKVLAIDQRQKKRFEVERK